MNEDLLYSNDILKEIVFNKVFNLSSLLSTPHVFYISLCHSFVTSLNFFDISNLFSFLSFALFSSLGFSSPLLSSHLVLSLFCSLFFPYLLFFL